MSKKMATAREEKEKKAVVVAVPAEAKAKALAKIRDLRRRVLQARKELRLQTKELNLIKAALKASAPLARFPQTGPERSPATEPPAARRRKPD